MQNKLIKHVGVGSFDAIEIGVVAIARDKVSIRFVPFGILYTKIFCQSVTFMTNQLLNSRRLASLAAKACSFVSNVPI